MKRSLLPWSVRWEFIYMSNEFGLNSFRGRVKMILRIAMEERQMRWWLGTIFLSFFPFLRNFIKEGRQYDTVARTRYRVQRWVLWSGACGLVIMLVCWEEKARQETITQTGGGPEEVTRNEWDESLVGVSAWVDDFLEALHGAVVGVRKQWNKATCGCFRDGTNPTMDSEARW